MGSSLEHGGFGKLPPHCQSASIRRAGEFAFGHVAFEMRDEIALGKSGNQSACHVRADRFPHPRWMCGTASGGRHSPFELVVNRDDRFEVAANHLALCLGGVGQKPLGLQAAPPAADPVHERDVVQLALVGGVRFKIGIAGNPSETQRLAQAAGGHAATGAIFGHTGFYPTLDFIVREFRQQSVVFP